LRIRDLVPHETSGRQHRTEQAHVGSPGPSGNLALAAIPLQYGDVAQDPKRGRSPALERYRSCQPRDGGSWGHEVAVVRNERSVASVLRPPAETHRHRVEDLGHIVRPCIGAILNDFPEMALRIPVTRRMRSRLAATSLSQQGTTIRPAGFHPSAL
jgi:hypothetical protein